MSIDTAMLRARLADFRTRKDAINDAINAGSDAVGPALELLHDRSDAVRWSATRILGEIGDKSAVGPLIEMLERGHSAVAAGNALREITGQDFGENGTSWREWAAEEAGMSVSSEREQLCDEDLVNAAVKPMNATIRKTREDRYLATVSLLAGRSQRVYIVFSAKDSEGEPIVWLYTPCCAAAPDKYEWALKRNLRLPYGAIGLAKIDGIDCFVMSNTHLRATADPEEIAKSIMNLATKGDAVEKMLSGDDKR